MKKRFAAISDPMKRSFWSCFLLLLGIALFTPLPGFGQDDVPAIASSAPDPLPEGASAPTLALQDLEGRVATFPVAGSWNLVFFWSLFCHTCLEEVPLLASESTRFADLPCTAFFVSLDTVRMQKGLENYVKKRKLSCRILLEETVAASRYFSADHWGVSQTPTTFLVDPAGKIVFQRQGPFDVEELWAKLREAAGKGKTP